MRSQKEIKNEILRLRNSSGYDPFGFRVELLMSFASSDVIKELVTNSEFVGSHSPEYDRVTVLRRIKSELRNVKSSLMGELHTSAYRSVVWIEACMWLLCDDAMVSFMKNTDNYGWGIVDEVEDKYGECLKLIM